ncbi:sensor histidine kinase [Paenibacillus endoradicis]|uniref:sensor histidine kinase n=1 Tax=Paenibacillus endoradicis TaxID=2972487 RepID=UPI00215997E0|nr:HAMP domain-containing sensor histidine kinase [Paenibacillus endoradicis]MCR8659840.1 HAMP domain-containing histidine kinase [Paenibacillus endoradicis]
MKLVHQINIAFGIALVLVISITAILIHYVLLDHFMVTQQADMKLVGSALTDTLKAEVMTESSNTLESTINPMISTHGITSIAAIVTDAQGNIIENTLSNSSSALEIFSSVDAIESTNLQQIWNGTDERFLTEVSIVPQGTLTLLTPVSKIKAIEQDLFGRLLIVFCIGGLLIMVLSHFITKKLITPLIKLKEELTKVKERQFASVNLVKAGGEIGAVAQTVYEMADELNRFNRAQKQFFQNASHELKSPLMSIAGYTEGIRDGVFEGESVRRGLDIILIESSRLKNIITEMTLLAKLDSEEDVYKPSTVSIKDLMQETLERVNPMTVKREVTLHCSYDDDEQLEVFADQDKLLQAFINVTSNAIRHAQKHIYIHAVIKKNRIELSISDDGSGIEEEVLPYLFHRFLKGKNGDTGLGLAISRAIVERCGGTITAENRKEGGALFTLSFPMMTEHQLTA